MGDKGLKQVIDLPPGSAVGTLAELAKDLANRAVPLLGARSVTLDVYASEDNLVIKTVVATPGSRLDCAVVSPRSNESSLRVPEPCLIRIESPTSMSPDRREARHSAPPERVYTFPLVTAGRQVGRMSLAFARESDPPTVDFVQKVVDQIATAVQRVERKEMAASSHEALVRERDHLAIVLEASRAAAALDLRELINRVASCIRRYQPWDYTGLALYEPAAKALRAHALSLVPGPLSKLYTTFPEGTLVPTEGTFAGRAFTTGQPCVANSRAEVAAQVSPSWADTLLPLLPPAHSGCSVPLVCQGKRLGTLSAACARDGAFDAAAVRLLCQLADAIAPAVDNALAYRRIQELTDRLAKEKTYLESEIGANTGEIIGDSPALRRVLALVDSVACMDTSVLIQGETGTGKELVARAIHRSSDRRDRTFVKLNCAAIPTGLLESELFGHEKGAFTGAVSQKPGRFELANGGTLFLDEVGDIPLDLQPKLLRVLQEQEFERLGGTRTIKVDVRVVAATNRDLVEMKDARTFRSDLFYRLNVFPIVVPPLRERREDIMGLVRHFVGRSSRRMKKTITAIPSETLEALSAYDWPGNVRELENVIERAVILSPGPDLQLSPNELQARERPTDEVPGDKEGSGELPHVRSDVPETLADAERTLILKTLRATNWVVAGKRGAAARLGLSRTTLQARMRKLGIVRPR